MKINDVFNKKLCAKYLDVIMISADGFFPL